MTDADMTDSDMTDWYRTYSDMTRVGHDLTGSGMSCYTQT